MAVVHRRARGAAAIGLGILFATATARAQAPAPLLSPMSPVPAAIPLPAPSVPVPRLRTPMPASANWWNAVNVSDVGLVQLAENAGPITAIASAGDSRLFIALRDGRIRIWSGTRLLDGVFLDLSDRVSTSGTGGLFSIAFDPWYAANGYFFVAYTDKAGNLVLARYSRSASKKNRADSRSGVALLTIPFPADADHYGGGLQFGPDGYLYAGIGDGGSAAKPSGNAQRDDVLLGKILRLDVGTRIASQPFYAIPPSNPFVGVGPPLDEIWAKGVRDPWRLTFDRGTGDLYIGDVGQSARQAVDFEQASSVGGANFGWPEVAPGTPGLQPPLLMYSRPDACTVVGGYVYRGTRDPRLSGIYFYGDYCTGFIWGRGQVTNVVVPRLTTFGEDASGELYAGSASGNLYLLTSTLPSAPGSQAMREPPPERDEAPPLVEPVEVFAHAEPEPPTAPVGTFVPPTFDPPFGTPAPVYVVGPDYSAAACPADVQASVESPPPPDQSTPPPQTPSQPPSGPQAPAPERPAPAPSPPHPPPRVVAPHR